MEGFFFLSFSILLHSKSTLMPLVSNNLTLRLRSICVIWLLGFFFFVIDWLGWGYFSILIIKRE